MPPTSLNDLQKDSLKTINNVSTPLRKAIAGALPVAPEQYLTIAIPGTVIDLDDGDSGGAFVYDTSKHAFPPTTVQVNEARLVDGMMPLSNIMVCSSKLWYDVRCLPPLHIGNTGKSVTRSYSRALDGLIPKKLDVENGGIRSPGNPDYKAAMTYLTTRDASTGLSPVDVYNQKLQAWGRAMSDWQEAKIDARRAAEQEYPSSLGGDFISKQQQYYADWNQENYFRYKSTTQGAYMD